MGATEYPYPVAIKTGTSSRFRDAWTVGFSQRYLVGVWVGDPDFRPMNRLSGYRSAAHLVRRIISHLHRDQAAGLEDLAFPAPRGFRTQRLCALTGRLASPACDRVLVEWLRPGEEPPDRCAAHVRLAIDTRSGRPASSLTPPAHSELRTFVDLPPRYAAWAAHAGLARPPRAATERGPATPTRPAAPSAVGSSPRFHVKVTSPEDGLRLLRDPETPPDRSTLALEAVVDPPVPQLVWYVDGMPYEVADYPYSVRWQLSPGEHRIQAQLPHAPVASAVVRVLVQ
jgi:penicillin-binding protein 1C